MQLDGQQAQIDRQTLRRSTILVAYCRTAYVCTQYIMSPLRDLSSYVVMRTILDKEKSGTCFPAAPGYQGSRDSIMIMIVFTVD